LATPKTGLNKFGDLKRRLLFLLGALIVYRIGTFIPVPGIDPLVLDQLFKSQQGGILGMFNMFSGGALSRFSVFALGIMPYISASIIVQLMTTVSPQLEALKKEGEAGRKITQHTRQARCSWRFSRHWDFDCAGIAGRLVLTRHGISSITMVTLTAGTMFLMWLVNRLPSVAGQRHSIIIFAGIGGLPNAIGGAGVDATGAFSIPLALMLFEAAPVTALVAFVERGQRKILVNYAKRQVGKMVVGGQSSHLPLKLNMAGVIPPIFASSIILFPATLAGWFGSGENMGWLKDIGSTLSPGQPVYVLLYALAIIFFCFFYTALVFNSKETADNWTAKNLTAQVINRTPSTRF
jgi:preprotein translocase subunit SecY